MNQTAGNGCLFCGVYVEEDLAANTIGNMLERSSGRMIEVTAQITANNETKIFNVFKFSGTVLVINQWAEIQAAPAISNCTNVFSTVYDGTNTVNLTANGANLSGAPVGSFFRKDKVATNTYTVSLANQVRAVETLPDARVGRPFTITAKNGADNYIRFHVTTNTTLDFTMLVQFEYMILNGGSLELAA